MRTRKFSFLLLLIGFCLTIGVKDSSAQTVVLSSDVDSVSVGDIIHLNIKVQLNQQVDEIIYPDSSSFPEELTWLNVQQFKLTDFSDSLSYRVQYFANQDVFIPSFPIGLVTQNDTSVVFSNSLILPFKTILPTSEAELKPIKPIIEFTSFPWGLLLISLVIFAALVWAYFTFTKKEPTQEIVKITQPVPFTNPLQHLESKLKELKTGYNLSETRDFKYFYSTVSDSIREYYEELYQIPALESTTREVIRFLDAFGVDHEMIQSTRSVLNKSDMVKFAKYEPTLDKAWDCYADAIDFIERAKLIDASRIARKKAEYESQWTQIDEADSQVDEDEIIKEEA
jgi:hypothetical protein